MRKNYLAKFTKYDEQCNFKMSISYGLKISAPLYLERTNAYSLQYSEQIIFKLHIAVWFWHIEYVIWRFHMDKLYSLYG